MYILCYTNIGVWPPLTSRRRGPQTCRNLKFFLVFVVPHFALLAECSDPRFLRIISLIIIWVRVRGGERGVQTGYLRYFTLTFNFTVLMIFLFSLQVT